MMRLGVKGVLEDMGMNVQVQVNMNSSAANIIASRRGSVKAH